jgi:stearoyl-CoA desaturase (delta-9 desaturase)
MHRTSVPPGILSLARDPKLISALVIFHVLALLCPMFYSFEALVVGIVLLLLAKYGITIGYHRLLTHSGFETYRWVRNTFATMGALAAEGSPPRWVSNHRLHHQFSDKPGDPHSPRDGGLHAHLGWLTYFRSTEEIDGLIERYAPDLWAEPHMRRLHRYYGSFQLGIGLATLLAGLLYGFFAYGGLERAFHYGMSFATLAFFARIVIVWHVTWCVNSVTHMWGYRNYKTRDDSTNNPVIGIIAGGEGWHNNHHAHPALAVHGHRWWEVDTSYTIIRFMRLIGLAWRVQDSIPRRAPAS